VTVRHGPDGCTVVAGYQPVMGTHLHLQITAPTEAACRAAEAAALDEAVRLQGLFTVFDPASPLCRWRSGADERLPAEVRDLLAVAADGQTRTGGAFNVRTAVLTRRWLQATSDGVEPSDGELAALAASIAAPPYEVDDGTVRRLADCSGVDLNAIAKGHIADLVAHRLLTERGATRVVVNAGGDLVHRGAGSVVVGIDDPRRGDGAPPLHRIEVADAAVATSGRARRWFDVAGRRWSRVLDPRTGRPADGTASATVVAPDAATAEVLATAASVLAPVDTLRLLDHVAGTGTAVAALVVEPDGTQHRSPMWAPISAPPPAAAPTPAAGAATPTGRRLEPTAGCPPAR